MYFGETKKFRFAVSLILVLILIMLFSGMALATDHSTGDPSGSNTGSATDITAQDAGNPTVEEIAAQVGKNR